MVNAKSALKSACFPVFLVLLLLTGCADTPFPSWLTGEPSESVLSAPRVVGTPPSVKDSSFPNLATVPSKPKDFSTTAKRNENIEEMTSDRFKAQAAKARLENAPAAPTAEPELVWPGFGSTQGTVR
jgi:hypothetical protein